VLRADRPKDISGRRALIAQRHGTGTAPRPAPGDLRLLPDTSFVGEPDLDGIGIDTLLTRDLVQKIGETFLKCSIAPSAWT
jgi:hypothetical protein